MIGKLWRRSRGSTLVEVVVAVGILSTVTSTVSAGLFQSLQTPAIVVDDGLALNELRKGLSWFAEDVKMARGASLTSGVLTLTWVDQFNDAAITHTITYALQGNQLVRTYDGSAHVAAWRALGASFSVAGRRVTAEIEVIAKPGTTRVLAVSSLMRSAAP